MPVQIEDYDDVERLLQTIAPVILQSSEPFLEKYSRLLSFVGIGLMVCVYAANNKIVVLLSGIVLVAVMVWSLIEMRQSKNIDNKTKKSSWTILLVLASVIGVVIIKLSVKNWPQTPFAR